MTTKLLQLNDVSKTFQQSDVNLTILKSVDFSINNGETVAICGPSGSGKSTFLNIASGLDAPSSGTVLFDNQDLSELSDEELSKIRLKEIGFVFQQHYLLPQCTALENILMPTLPLGTSNELRDRAHELLKAVGLTDRAHHLPSMLSGGECQRVAVARALINQPRLLFADEPTGSLDNQSAEAMTDLLLELNRRYKTSLIVVTHSDTLASNMQLKYTLHDGSLIK